MPKTGLPLALTAVRGGLVARSSLVAAGVDDDLGDRLVRAGRWRRLAPSVYLAGTGVPTDAQLVAAALLHVGRSAVVTGLVACRALQLPDVPAEPVVEVVVPPGTRAVTTPHVVVHQSARPLPTWTWRGARCAMPVRAVVDGGRRLADLRSVRALLLGAVSSGACSATELAAEVEAGGRRGSALVRRAAADALAGAWSAPEAEAADLVGQAVRARRLPPFVLNPVVSVRGERVGQPDGWLLGTRVGWQVDSRRHHGSADDLDATLAVHDRFARHGLVLLHVTPRRLRAAGPAWVEALVDAARAGRGAPEGLRVVPHTAEQPRSLRARRAG